MARITPGRRSAELGAEGVVVFLVGMRINRLWQVWRWLPVAVAMPRMIAELMRAPELGLLGTPRTFVSGRVVQVQQYWRSFEDLERYARSPEREHLPAWRAFNRRIRDNGSVAVFHETYVVHPGQAEAIYVNMPAYGLGAALSQRPTAEVGQSAAARIGAAAPAEPPVEPY